MKIAIFSDTHLLDTFDRDKYNYLKYLAENHDKLIMNGDLWEGQVISFDKFLSSEWSKLFPLFKEKKMVYIYGNHDKEEMLDERYKQFADEVHYEYELDLENSDKKLHVIHGDQFFNYPFTSFRTHPYFLKLVSYPNRIRIKLENKLGKKYGWKKQDFLAMEKDPEKMVKTANSERFNGKILVTSHTHYPIFLPEKNLINTGLINYHLASYLSVKDGKLELIKETY